MKFKIFAIATSMLALAACGNSDNTNNADLLRGANFVTEESGVQITLAFDADEMMAHGSVVNMYHGPYSVDGNNIKFGNMGSTMMMGPTEAMAVEQDYFRFLEQVETYNLSDGNLTLRGVDGKEIIFTQVDELPAAE